MPLKVNCPQCQTILTVQESIQPNKGVRCPKCQLKFIPSMKSTSAPAMAGAPWAVVGVVLLIVSVAVGAVVWNQLSNQKTPPDGVAQNKPAPVNPSANVSTSPTEMQSSAVSDPPLAPIPELAPKKQTSIKPAPIDDDLPDVPIPMVKKALPKTYVETAAPTQNPESPPTQVEVQTPKIQAPAAVFRHPKQKEINAAIDRGVAMIKNGGPLGVLADKNAPLGLINNHAMGYAAFRGLTLLECDVSPKDTTVQQIAQLIRKSPLPKSMFRTYDLATALLFLDRLGDARDRALIQHFALLLVAGQTARGMWGYEGPDLSGAELRQLLTFLEATQVAPMPGESDAKTDPLKKTPAKPNRPLPGRQTLSQAVQLIHVVNHHYTKGQGPPTGFLAMQGQDLSNTQFALLALWAGRRHGVPSERCLERAADAIRVTQRADGGWNYKPELINIDSSPAMTCVGLLGLAMGQAAAPTKAESQGKLPEDSAIGRALAKIGHHIDVNDFSGNFYYLWSLERVGMLYKLKTIGGRDWYDVGVEMLLPSQFENGSWTLGQNYFGGNAELSTCFALLFLKRSNLVQDLTERLPLLMTISDPTAKSNR